MTMNIFLLILWIIIGIGQIISMNMGNSCSWLNYWFCFIVLVLEYIEDIVEERRS